MLRNSRTLRTTIAVLIGAVFVVILALENRRGVAVRIFWWSIPHVSLALLMAICLFLGAGLALAAVLWDGRKHPAETSSPDPKISYDFPPIPSAGDESGPIESAGESPPADTSQ